MAKQVHIQDLDLLEKDLLALEVETFEIEDIVDVEQHAAGDACSSTSSSTCSSTSSGGGGERAV